MLSTLIDVTAGVIFPGQVDAKGDDGYVSPSLSIGFWAIMNSRRRNLRQLLLLRSEWFEERVFLGAEKKGYGFITPAMVRLFAHMGRKPIGIPELGRRLSISRQAVHATLKEASRHGVVEFLDCDFDKRMKLVQFSPAGLDMLAAAAKTMEEVEQELESRVGKKDVETLCRILEKTW